MQKSILVPSQSITYLGVCLDSVEMRARLSGECAVSILSSLRHCRQGSSVQLKDFQRLLGLMAAASAVCHLGLLHMRPLQLWLKSRVPWTAWTSGCLSIAVTRRWRINRLELETVFLDLKDFQEPRGGQAFEEGNSSRRVEIAPRVGSDDLEPLQESGGRFATSENAHCPLFFSLSHSPLEGDALTSLWPAARLYAFPLIKILPLVYARSGRSEHK